MTHPRDMHMSALIYWVEQGLVDCFAIDFLSDKAQKSIARFIAADVEKFYQWVEKNKDRDDFWTMKYHNPSNGHRSFFYNSAMKHPLVAMFGDPMAKAIENAVLPVFQDLEKGNSPERAI